MPFRYSSFRFSGLLLIWALSAVVPTLARSQSPADEHARLELVSEQDALVPGKQNRIGIRFDLQDGWHTYWVNPGDSGEPPRIDWQLPTGFQINAIQWPHPQRLSTPPLADYGYEHQVLLMTSVRLPEHLRAEESARIVADVHYLVCRDVCIPGRKHLELLLPVKPRAVSSESRPLFEAARQRVPRTIPQNWKISATSTEKEFVVNLRTNELANTVQFFPLHAEQIDNAAPQEMKVVRGGFRLHLKKSEHLLKPVSLLEGVIVLPSGNAYSVRIPVSQPSKNNHVQSND